MDATKEMLQHTSCYHCGEDCENGHIHIGEKIFCCEGCRTVYAILEQNGLCSYYDFGKNPGQAQRIKVREGKFAFLDNAEIADKLVHFSESDQKHLTLYLPQMHCSSCIWLLEHLARLNSGIIRSQVNFMKKEVTIVFDPQRTGLRAIAELLASIGYEPHLSLSDLSNTKLKTYNKARLYKLGIAGFCFGNIMLLSFPEYFSSGEINEAALKKTFSYLNLALSLPVLFYCASEFFISAFRSIKQRFLNIDAPIALAILITFTRSAFEILAGTGAGYLDAMSGIVFFMLIGRFFQDKTYRALTFDRDYRSYFPIGVTKLKEDRSEAQIPVSAIRKGHRLKIHSQEIIPADGILFMGKGSIDYSFVTGESLPSEKGIGELVYAGGRQIGAAIEIEVVKEVAQGYLTQLWNNDAFKKQKTGEKNSFVHRLSRYFTWVLFSIAAAAAVYWQIHDPSGVWNAVTSVLIVACPCALLLSATFTDGNMLGRLQKVGFFVRNAAVLESIREVDTIVFDKTGTISMQAEAKVAFECGVLSDYEKQLVRSIARHSTHPLSRTIAAYLPLQHQYSVKHFYEEKGQGCMALVNNEVVRIGSESFVTGCRSSHNPDSAMVYVSVNAEILGYFSVRTVYREGLSELVDRLGPMYRLAVISGDNNAEERALSEIFGVGAALLFEQSPQQKLEYIRALQLKGAKVLMIGDGLNDAGALRQSDVGVVISDDINNFSPACDAILEGRQFSKLDRLIAYASKEKNIICGSFILSIAYNIIGLYFAVRGELSPVIAAILMPLSSASIVLYTTLLSSWLGRKLKQ